MFYNIVDKIKSFVLNEDSEPYNQDEFFEYIIEDTRKRKFINYSKSINFYKLSYERMNKAVALGSRYALLAKKKKQKYGKFYDEEYLYYFKLIPYTDNYGITEADKIELEEDYYDTKN